MLNNESINNISYSEILDGLGHKEEVIFDVYFYSENKLSTNFIPLL